MYLNYVFNKVISTLLNTPIAKNCLMLRKTFADCIQ